MTSFLERICPTLYRVAVIYYSGGGNRPHLPRNQPLEGEDLEEQQEILRETSTCYNRGMAISSGGGLGVSIVCFLLWLIMKAALPGEKILHTALWITSLIIFLLSVIPFMLMVIVIRRIWLSITKVNAEAVTFTEGFVQLPGNQGPQEVQI